MPVSTFPTIAYMLEPIEGAACPRVGGELRRVTGRAADKSTAYQNCKTAAARHEGQQ